jgi:methionyl aminopeptidase
MNSPIPIKTAEDIQKIRHAAWVLKKTLDLLESSVRPGVTTKELDVIAEDFICSHEGCIPGFKGYRGFPGSLCASVNSEVVHGIPDNKHVLKNGDIIGLDCGVYYQGFHTDACRTILVGKVDSGVRHFVKTTKKALNAAVKVVRPGARVGDISAIIQKTLERQGYSPVADCTGHGVGRNLHEPPEILNVGQKGTGPQLKAGMVLAIEPIANMGKGDIETLEDGWTLVSADGSTSAHFEHTVLVTEKGYEVLV